MRRISMINAVLPSHVRNGVLAGMGGIPLGTIGGLPVVTNEAPTQELALAAYVEVDPALMTSSIVVAIADYAVSSSIATHLADLTNGTHLGPAGALIGVGCGNQTAAPLSVDFVWVVDNSASMQEEQQALSIAADRFFDALGRSRLDFRLGVVATDGEALRGGGFTTDVGEFKSRVRVGINGNGREEGLEYALRAVGRAKTATLAGERLRDDAVTAVIFYSDEESTNLRPVQDYLNDLRDLGVLAFAIVGPRPRGCVSIGTGAARVGESYIRAAEYLGGASASICSSNLTGPIEEILIAAAGAASRTQLGEEPISGSIEVATSSTVIPRDRVLGFDYEPGANSILFFGEATPETGADFRVSYLKFLPFVP